MALLSPGFLCFSVLDNPSLASATPTPASTFHLPTHTPRLAAALSPLSSSASAPQAKAVSVLSLPRGHGVPQPVHPLPCASPWTRTPCSQRCWPAEPFTVQPKCTPSHLILGPLVFEEAGLDHLTLQPWPFLPTRRSNSNLHHVSHCLKLTQNRQWQQRKVGGMVEGLNLASKSQMLQEKMNN